MAEGNGNGHRLFDVEPPRNGSLVGRVTDAAKTETGKLALRALVAVVSVILLPTLGALILNSQAAINKSIEDSERRLKESIGALDGRVSRNNDFFIKALDKVVTLQDEHSIELGKRAQEAQDTIHRIDALSARANATDGALSKAIEDRYRPADAAAAAALTDQRFMGQQHQLDEHGRKIEALETERILRNSGVTPSPRSPRNP